jgi:hypothetical protein
MVLPRFLAGHFKWFITILRSAGGYLLDAAEDTPTYELCAGLFIFPLSSLRLVFHYLFPQIYLGRHSCTLHMH